MGTGHGYKLMKYWYMKEQRICSCKKKMLLPNAIVESANTPTFLFNTLNNIFSYTQNTSAVAFKLVMGLSDMLRYMLYECNQPLVPLAKELKMLKGLYHA
jgi:LytS/YehU family sensor histidine kinase